MRGGGARLDGLGDGSDLVDLEQETVAGLLLDGAVKPKASQRDSS